MKKTIPTIAFFFCALFSSAQNWDQIIKAAASDRAANDNFGYSVAISGDYAIVGACNEDAGGGNTLVYAGSAYIFVRSGGTWLQQQKLVANDPASADQFGISVAINGDYAIVGARLEDENASGSATLSDAGAAYIFVRSGNSWIQQQKIVASDRAANDWFGWSVAISGDYAIVGAYQEDENAAGGATMTDAGSAYIFVRSGTTWTQQQKIVASDRTVYDRFGYSVAISGDYAIIGADGEDQDALGGATLAGAGSAYIFVRSGNTWTQQQKIVASDRAVEDYFGTGVAISGDYAIVGAIWEDHNATGAVAISNAGSAYIFVRSGSTWTQQQKIVASDRSAYDLFGWSVAISGDYAVVGAFPDDEDASGGAALNNAGSAYIFVRSGTNWTQQQKIVASDRGADDQFGISVAISGGYTIVGANLEDENASGGATLSDAGAVYFFDQNFTLTAAAGANGTVTPSGATTVVGGGSQTYTITPAAGYCVQDVLVNGSSVGAVTTYTFNNVQANQTISASFVAAPIWYLDADNDGYYTQSISNCGNPGAGYNQTATTQGDCDDADNAKWQSASLFIDADNDGYDNGSATVCYGASIPTGYKTNTSGADCNDADANKNATYSFYTDADGDSYGTGSLISGVCATNSTTPPSGYSTNNTDCDDADNSKWQLLSGYVDADGDGFTVGNIQEVCSGNTLTQGYSSSSLGEDTDDNNPNVTNGISNLGNSKDMVKIYPNPVSGNFTIELQNGHGYHSFQLTDIAGKVLQQSGIISSVTEKQIDISALSDGIYMVRLLGVTSAGTYKIIKQQKP